MANRNAPIGLQDHMLFASITMLLTDPMREETWVEQAYAMIDEAMPGVSADHPMIKPLIDAADRLKYARDFKGGVVERGNEWNNARFHALQAVHDFSKWRAVRSQEVLRQQGEAA